MSGTIADLFCNRIEAAGRAERWGIGRASNYLKHLDVDDTLRKERAAQLVYADEGCVIRKPGEVAYEVTDHLVEEPDGTTSPVLRALQVKAAKEPTPGAVMEFTSVVTSVRRDRDGDILEPQGARVDMKGPLLWNHLSTEPIGKPLEILKQNSRLLVMRFAIADTPLGRDIAQLVDFGALQRMSHGFIPEEYEEMTDKAGNFTGWRVQAYEMLEQSIVSVASNTDAVITVMGRAKLHHPLVKSWAGKLFDERPVVVRGASPPVKESPEQPGDTSVEPEVKAAMETAEADAVSMKTGRALSKANERRITESRDDCNAIAEMDGVPRAGVALAKAAAERLTEILEALNIDDDGDKETGAIAEKQPEPAPEKKPERKVDVKGLVDAARNAASGAIKATKRL